MEAKDTVMSNGVKRQFRILLRKPTGDCSRWDIENMLLKQAEITWPIAFKAGIKEMVEWAEHNLFYIALEYDGTPVLKLQSDEHRSAEKWQAKLKELEVKDG